MAYQALYRKYRPHNFEDFIDQNNTKKILINSILNDKISHAYLFSGSRGIGKTSMAKIFAKAINCSNFKENNDVCDECENCIECNNQSVDIIEIDAASNNGVDQIRDLKNRVTIVPSKLKYKVYIIDEVHMLTNSAFNALLKTLEEPPSHSVFILATTEFYEVPETIVSRCQCFNFTRITMKSLIERLHFIANKENIDIDDETIEEIANYSNGGLRDAIGMLDKLYSFSSKKITIDTFKSINGMISKDDIIEFYESLLKQDAKKVLNIINKIEEQGYDFKNFVERTMIYARDNIINYYVDNSSLIGDIKQNLMLVDVLNDLLIRLKDAVNPMVVVQISILKYFENQKNISREIEKKDNKIISLEIKREENKNNFEEINNKIISQEINGKNISREIDDEHINQNNNVRSKIVVNEKNKNIRINNAMATANINLKKEMTSLWNNLNKYFMDEKYNKIAQLLSDTVPMVVGTDYMIIIAENEGLIENLYKNIDLVENFIEMIYQKMKVVFVKNKEFDKIKEKYINDKKNNIIYHIQEEYGKIIDVQDSLINQAISVFGTDLVEIE